LAASKQTNWRRRVSKWIAPTGVAATISFLALVVLLELIIIYSSISLGLEDTNPLAWNTGAFTISISPIFHLLPVSVIIVLFASWIYLTRHIPNTPTRLQPAKTIRPLPPPRRYEKRRFRILRRFISRLNKKIDDAGRSIKERISESQLAKYLDQHVAGKAVFKSAWTVVLSFSVLALVAYLIIYPQLIPNAVNWLFGGGSSLLDGFVAWTANAANAVGQTLSPLGWLAANINNGLAAAAPSFRSGVIDLTTPIVKPLVDLSLVGKYVLSQNVAAWASAIIALYAGRPNRRRR
jgi:hypothetical protein